LDQHQNKIGDASGFVVMRMGHGVFLCTNKHVFLGSKNLTLQAPNKKSPAYVQVWFYHTSHAGQIMWKRQIISLHDGSGGKTWLCHPTMSNYDIALLKIELEPGLDIRSLIFNHSTFSRLILPGTKVHIIGFPYGLTNGPNAPIWKTGHVAADTTIHWGNEPVLLVDGETSEGMSGSPVFIASNEQYDPEKGITLQFVGMYSGRVEVTSNNSIPENMYPKLARVWNPFGIEETFLNNGLK
jgi:hypothetical protein